MDHGQRRPAGAAGTAAGSPSTAGIDNRQADIFSTSPSPAANPAGASIHSDHAAEPLATSADGESQRASSAASDTTEAETAAALQWLTNSSAQASVSSAPTSLSPPPPLPPSLLAVTSNAATAATPATCEGSQSQDLQQQAQQQPQQQQQQHLQQQHQGQQFERRRRSNTTAGTTRAPPRPPAQQQQQQDQQQQQQRPRANTMATPGGAQYHRPLRRTLTGLEETVGDPKSAAATAEAAGAAREAATAAAAASGRKYSSSATPVRDGPRTPQQQQRQQQQQQGAVAPPLSTALTRQASVTTVRPRAYSVETRPSVRDIFGPDAFAPPKAPAPAPAAAVSAAAEGKGAMDGAIRGGDGGGGGGGGGGGAADSGGGGGGGANGGSRAGAAAVPAKQPSLWSGDPDFERQITHVEESGEDDDDDDGGTADGGASGGGSTDVTELDAAAERMPTQPGAAGDGVARSTSGGVRDEAGGGGSGGGASALMSLFSAPHDDASGPGGSGSGPEAVSSDAGIRAGGGGGGGEAGGGAGRSARGGGGGGGGARVQRLYSASSARSMASRDSDRAAELRERGDAFPGDSDYGAAGGGERGRGGAAAVQHKSPPRLRRARPVGFKDGSGGGGGGGSGTVAEGGGGTVRRGGGGDLAAAAAALGAVRRKGGEGWESDGEQSGQAQDPQWRERVGADMQALGRRLAYKNRGAKGGPRGEWGLGLEDPWKIRGRTALFLVLLGVLHGTAVYAIDRCINAMQAARRRFGDGTSYGAEFVVYAVYMLTGTCLAAAITAAFAPETAGSGIPVMKWMLGTDDIKSKAASRFTATAWGVKVVGLVLAAGTGLNIGREGPFVHLAGMAAYQLLTRVSAFEGVLASGSLVRQVLVASTSLGVSSVFSATIGGVLLAVEITSTYYLVAQYFKAFLAAVSGAVTVKLLLWAVRGQAYAKADEVAANFTTLSYSYFEVAMFLAIGVASGLLGPQYVRMRLACMRRCRALGRWDLRHRARGTREWSAFMWRSVAVAAGVSAITATLSYFPGDFNQLGPFEVYADLLSPQLPPRWDGGGTWSKWWALGVSFATRWIMAALGTSIVVPAGDFIQTAVLGAILGRAAGELLQRFFPAVQPAVYALIGSASFAGGATQSISAAVVLMEFTGSFVLELPALMTILIAYAISCTQGLNIYDSVMKLNGLRTLQGLKFDPEKAARQRAVDIADHDLRVVTSEPTVEEVVALLEEDRGRATIRDFPVVTDLHDMTLLGTISRRHLARCVRTISHHNRAFTSHITSRIRKDLLALSPQQASGLSRTLAGLYEHWRTRTFGDTFSRMDSPEPSSDGDRARGGRGGGKSPSRSPSRSPLWGRSPGGGGHAHGGNGNGGGAAGRRHPTERLNLVVLKQSGWEEGRLAQALQEEFLSKRIDLIAEDQQGNVFIDPSAWTVPENMPLGHLHVLFELLRATRLFVTAAGQLRGVITRDRIYQALQATLDPPPSARDAAPRGGSCLSESRRGGCGYGAGGGGGGDTAGGIDSPSLHDLPV